MTLKDTKHRQSVEYLCVWKTVSPSLFSRDPGFAVITENALTVVGFAHQTLLATAFLFHLAARVHCSHFSYSCSPRSPLPSPLHPAPGAVLLGSLELMIVSHRVGALCLKMSHDCCGGCFKLPWGRADSGQVNPLSLLGSFHSPILPPCPFLFSFLPSMYMCTYMHVCEPV